MKQKFSYRLTFTVDEEHITQFRYVFSAMQRIISNFCTRFDIEWRLHKVQNDI